MQKLFITGNLVRDPESRQTSAGKSVCNFTVAVNRREKDENGNNKADFFRVAAWGQMGENCQKYLSKGRKVTVIGTVSIHVYTDKEGKPAGSMEVFAQEVEFLSSGTQGNAEKNASAPAQAEEQTGGFTAVERDDLPF